MMGKSQEMLEKYLISITRLQKYLQKCDANINIMLSLTNCKVHSAKYSNRSFDIRTE